MELAVIGHVVGWGLVVLILAIIGAIAVVSWILNKIL